MPYSPEESQPSSLSEEFLTTIQRVTEEWRGSLPLDESGLSISILLSGIEQLIVLINGTISDQKLSQTVLDDLEWGDGEVDIPQQVAAYTKKVITDVIEEFGRSLSRP